MTQFSPQFAPFAARMQDTGLPEIFIETFADYYEQLLQGNTGLIPESEIRPVTSLPDMETLPPRLAKVGEAALAKTAVIKLNGGLGTSMGLDQAKSLLPVKDGLSFIDIIAQQVLAIGVPLILMNSFATEKDSLEKLRAYPDLWGRLPMSFLQHKAPKINRNDFSPITWLANPELEWCPPGHGDIYAALVTRGALDALLEANYEYAFISNADNLGAVVNTTLLGYFAGNQFPFMMEVADRTRMDKKGGHLAQRLDGQLILRESAQCPPEDEDAFQDITRYKYFNTNNLWLHLPALKQVMVERQYRLGLPLIRNAKTVDPRDSNSTPIYQLETAMGTAVVAFPGAQAVRVPRTRFAPVKKTDDLLAVRSDAYRLRDNWHIVPVSEGRAEPVVVELDPAYYEFISDLDARFPYGPPSLKECSHFVLRGDFKFGRNVRAKGSVLLVNESDKQVEIPDDTLLEGEYQHGQFSQEEKLLSGKV